MVMMEKSVRARKPRAKTKIYKDVQNQAQQRKADQTLYSFLQMILDMEKLDVLAKRRLKLHILMRLQKKVYGSPNITPEAQCAHLRDARC